MASTKLPQRRLRRPRRQNDAALAAWVSDAEPEPSDVEAVEPSSVEATKPPSVEVAERPDVEAPERPVEDEESSPAVKSKVGLAPRVRGRDRRRATLYFDPEVARCLKREAFETEQDMAEIVNRVLQRRFKRKGLLG